MSFIQDALAIFKKRELVFLESNKESEDVYSFLFEKEKDLTWKAGQHGLFTITHKKIKNPIRPFTIASAPTENMIRLTMRIHEQPSDFKKAMLELKQGMHVKMSGPVGGFFLKDDSPSLLIAGGIGITPFRSIIKQLEAEQNERDNKIHLLYLDSHNLFTFKDELEGMADSTSIDITYLESKDELHQEIAKFSSSYKNSGNYYIAGPKSMVDAVSTHLQNNNIPKKNIKKDAFFGY
ncbi:FAD-dependent oxidoreductase [Sporosarcina beigongshangi]|uniref:FAD-dependent oxidoreductase n=1 Tax=Sporosarcina beigongshangi TaxID=2782538 RepID=UPI0019392D46|nr:FAD-dependent oxidoreductase [Sporosarcina beigongshangi]